MKLIIHTQYFPPEIGAPQTRLSALARVLQSHGFDVTILTAMPNYPLGRLYPGYKGFFRRETLGSIPILRSWIYPTKSTNTVARLWNYFSFVLSSFFVGLFLCKNCDLIFTESPPLFLGITGYLLSRLKGARWIFNISDLWPQSAVELGVIASGSPSHRLSIWLEDYLYRKSWLVTGQSKSILASITEKLPGLKTYHLSNGTDIEKFSPNKLSEKIHNEMGGDIVVAYAGLHGLAQGLDQVLFAIDQVRDIPDLHFVFIGEGPLKPDLLQQAKQLELLNIKFIDSLPMDEIPALIASADICLVPLKMYLPGAVPSKLYEAMASGKPVLLIAEGEAADIIIHNNAGLVVKPGDMDGLVNSIRLLASDTELRQKLGRSGRQAAIKFFNHGQIFESFARFLKTEIEL